MELNYAYDEHVTGENQSKLILKLQREYVAIFRGNGVVLIRKKNVFNL